MTLLATAASAAEPLPVVERPALEQALKDAPVLQTESPGEPARSVNFWERGMVPNPDEADSALVQWRKVYALRQRIKDLKDPVFSTEYPGATGYWSGGGFNPAWSRAAGNSTHEGA